MNEDEQAILIERLIDALSDLTVEVSRLTDAVFSATGIDRAANQDTTE